RSSRTRGRSRARPCGSTSSRTGASRERLLPRGRRPRPASPLERRRPPRRVPTRPRRGIRAHERREVRPVSLKFSPKAHRYWIDGKPAPGVTTILGKGIPKPAIPYWAARTVAEYVADEPEKVEALRAAGRDP